MSIPAYVLIAAIASLFTGLGFETLAIQSHMSSGKSIMHTLSLKAQKDYAVTGGVFLVLALLLMAVHFYLKS